MKVLREVAVIVLLVALLSGAALYFVQSTTRFGPPSGFHEGRAVATLKTYCRAQAEYYSIGHTSTGKGTYWRKDIAGLFSVKGADGKEVRLITTELAGADAQPVARVGPGDGPVPTQGYLCVALPFKGEAHLNPSRFAAAAFPGPYNTWPWMFAISESGVIYKKVCPDKKPPAAFPEDPVKEGWERVYDQG